MIVTCDSCEANFRVDDSRIPPQGIKVRCSKCKHVFMVTREVPEDFMTELEDFESFHRSQMEAGDIGGEEGVEEPAEPMARIPEEPGGGISFEEFMAKEEPVPEVAEPELPSEESISSELEEAEASVPEEADFGGIDSEPSFGLESSDTVETPSEQAIPDMEETKLSVEEYFREEMKQEAEGQARGVALDSVDEKKLEDLVKEKSLEPRPARRRSSFRAILLLVVLLTLGAVGYLWWQSQGASFSLPIQIGPTFEALTGKVSELWEDILGFRKGNLELSGLEGHEDEIGQHRVYIITGDVTNKSRRAVKRVKLKVVILDQAGNRIKEKEVFGGNVFTREELEKVSPRFFTGEEILQPKRPKDMVVEPDRTISFMAIFSGLPREGKSFKVEILEAPGV